MNPKLSTVLTYSIFFLENSVSWVPVVGLLGQEMENLDVAGITPRPPISETPVAA